MRPGKWHLIFAMVIGVLAALACELAPKDVHGPALLDVVAAPASDDARVLARNP